ncbi:condensation domain-containing protein [Streptomyces litchfieldiae]|uniref:Condensation domain-containing protein n=1 Tax=Streptomyces litchfieldiae TaxID=3075543 RepID=A0ABU2MWH3_9ACTN|nr:condensation domain-containing protein [Streptomyces sp. DSM 44938]MDT0345434.1 condensation domain-containing protein [Streptomyces sp. DSM 44938]
MERTTELRFADGDAGEFPATWSQREFWATVREHRPDGFYQIVWDTHLPDGRDLGEVLACLRRLVLRHQALRTTVSRDETAGLRQIVRGEGSLPVRIEDVADAGEGVHACEKLKAEFLAGEPHVDRDPPLKIAAVTRGGRVRSLVLACSHVVLDGGSVAVLEDELAALLASGPDAALPPVAHTPADRAAEEQGPAAARVSERSLAHWRATLLDAPVAPFAHIPGGRAPLWLGRLTSRRLWRAESSLVAGTGLTSGSVYLTAAACVLAEVTGRSRLTFRVPTGNRFTPVALDFVGALSQHALITVDTAPRDTAGGFAELARTVERGLRRAYSRARYDPDELRRTIVETEAERGAPADLTYLFNDLRDEADKPGGGGWPMTAREGKAEEAEEEEPELAWELLHAANSDIKLYVRVSGGAGLGGVDVAADEGCLTRAETEHVLRATERLIVAQSPGC